MRNLKIIFTVITMMAFVCSCNNSDEPKPNGVNEKPFKGIIFTAGSLILKETMVVFICNVFQIYNLEVMTIPTVYQ